MCPTHCAIDVQHNFGAHDTAGRWPIRSVPRISYVHIHNTGGPTFKWRGRWWRWCLRYRADPVTAAWAFAALRRAPECARALNATFLGTIGRDHPWGVRLIPLGVAQSQSGFADSIGGGHRLTVGSRHSEDPCAHRPIEARCRRISSLLTMRAPYESAQGGADKMAHARAPGLPAESAKFRTNGPGMRPTRGPARALEKDSSQH